MIFSEWLTRFVLKRGLLRLFKHWGCHRRRDRHFDFGTLAEPAVMIRQLGALPNKNVLVPDARIDGSVVSMVGRRRLGDEISILVSILALAAASLRDGSVQSNLHSVISVVCRNASDVVPVRYIQRSQCCHEFPPLGS